MYRNNNKYIYIINALLVILIVISFVSTKNVEVDSKSVITKNDSLITYLKSNYIEKIEQEEVVKEETKEEIEIKNEIEKSEEKVKETLEKKQEEKKEESKKVETTTKKEQSTTKTEETKNETKKEENLTPKEETTSDVPADKKKDAKVIETLKGSLAGYGPDCYGCTSFRTASGRYIGDGKIYYDDKEFGKIRIVAGDKSYPFGTIVRISNTNYGDNSPIYAIVLDRGGGVGKGKNFLFDLLFETEKDAAKAGSRKNVTFEILRLGY